MSIRRAEGTPTPSLPTAVLLLSLLGAAACDVPTRPPAWDTRWIGPIRSLTVPTDSLLPPGVTVSAEGSGFEIELAAVRLSRTLGELCPECRPLDGTVATKPAFSSSVSTPIPLPDDVYSATLGETRARARALHSFTFDPLRPGGASTGSLTVGILALDEPIAGDTLTGSEIALPPHSPVELELPLADADLGGASVASVALTSPEGEPTRIDTSDSLTITVPATRLFAREVDIAVDGLRIEVEPVELDLQGINSTVRDAVRGGALLLAMENPFSIRGRLDLRLVTDGTEISKTVALEPGTTSQRVEFTSSELQALLRGGTVRLAAVAVVSAADGTATVRPSRRLVIDSRFEVVMGVRP